MEHVELARAASERGEVVLRSRRTTDGARVLELRVNGVFVMDTHETTSERALAEAALARVAQPRDVLVAGLGLGFTARAVLDDPRVQRLDVIEIEESLVGWMRDGTVPHGPALLADERLRVLTDDVAQAMLDAPPASYDLVLLDVDNGPGFLVYQDNAELYRPGFLAGVAQALRRGGAVAVWSAAESPALGDALLEVFGEAIPIPYRVTLQGREERYWLYLAHR